MSFLEDLPVIGGLFKGGGGPSYQPDRANYDYGSGTAGGYGHQQADAARNREGPQVGYGNADESRGLGMSSRDQMGQHVKGMQQWATDASSSVAAQQFRQQSDEAARQAMAVARSGRGGNIALAQRAGVNAGAQMGQQAAGQAATLRAQEQQWYQGQIGQMLAQQRAQDLQAQGLDAQQAQYQAMLEMQQRQLNDQSALGYDQLAHQAMMGEMQGGMAYDAAKGGYQSQVDAANERNAAMQRNAAIGLGTAVATGGYSLLGSAASEDDKP